MSRDSGIREAEDPRARLVSADRTRRDACDAPRDGYRDELRTHTACWRPQPGKQPAGADHPEGQDGEPRLPRFERRETEPSGQRAFHQECGQDHDRTPLARHRSGPQEGQNGEHTAMLIRRFRQAELAEDRRHVVLDGTLGDDEPLGYRAVG